MPEALARAYVTDAGRALIAKAAAEETSICYTDARVGSGTTAAPRTMTALAEDIMPADIISIGRPRDHEVTLVLQLLSCDAPAAFPVTEAAVFAADPDLGRILYAYVDLHLDPVAMPDSVTQPGKALTLSVSVFVGDAADISAVLSPDGLVRREAFDGLVARVEALEMELSGAENFRGYVQAPDDLAGIASPKANNFAYVAGTLTVWRYDGTAWSDTGVPVPDQITPLSDYTPLPDAVPGAPGAGGLAARWDHRHPLDQTKQDRLPAGMIILWYGAVSDIPAGWTLCDGANGTPDLRGRFVVGAGGSYAPGATGGADSVTLDLSQIPAHSHSYTGPTSASNSGSGSGLTWNMGSQTTGAAGGNAAHENRPPYYALCYIMLIS